MINSYKKKLRCFVNREAAQKKLFAGNNLHSNPIQTTQRLYKSVLHTGLIAAMEFVDEKDTISSIELLEDLIPLCEYAVDLNDCMQLHSLISW